jgi:hypothetical protein
MKTSTVNTKKTNYKIDFDLTNKIMITSFFGIVDLKDIIDSLSAGIRQNEFEINMSACFDFTNATVDADISATEIVFHFLTGLQDRRGNEYHLALVYSDEITKTLMDYYRLAFSRSKVDVELFQNKDAAMNWIITSQKVCSVTYLPKPN